MDSEEHKEVQHAIRHGHPETDEGPYYHEAWWEAYKGGVKGLLGGLLIGAGVGVVIGLPVAGALAALEIGGLTTAAIPGIVAAFSAGGMMVGAHEFMTVGIVAGSDAASHDASEKRGRADLARAVGEIKAELAEIKALVKGQPEEAAVVEKEIARLSIPPEDGPNRTTHCDDHCPPSERKLVFWNVATIGAMVGAAAGALLVGGGLAGHILDFLGSSAAEHFTAQSAGAYAAAAITGGAAGASFGINRDIFRQVFDTTDHWFRGILINGQHDPKPEIQQTIQHQINAPQPTALQSESTYFRDKLKASSILAEMGHTNSIRH